MSDGARTVHLVTQRNQPYGSTRMCCEICGSMVIGKLAPAWTDDLLQWEDRRFLSDSGYVRCDDLRRENERLRRAAADVLES